MYPALVDHNDRRDVTAPRPGETTTEWAPERGGAAGRGDGEVNSGSTGGGSGREVDVGDNRA
jgi:hypothetical protein